MYLGIFIIFLFYPTGLSLSMSLPHKYNHRGFTLFLTYGTASAFLSLLCTVFHMFFFQKNLHYHLAYVHKEKKNSGSLWFTPQFKENLYFYDVMLMLSICFLFWTVFIGVRYSNIFHKNNLKFSCSRTLYVAFGFHECLIKCPWKSSRCGKSVYRLFP